MKNISIGKSMNSRDKQLLIALLFIVIAFLCYYFIISPQLDKGKILKEEALSLQAKLDHSNQIVANLDDTRKKEESQREILLKKYKPFYHDLIGERLLYKFDSLMTASGFQPTAYSISGFSAEPISIERNDYIPLGYPLLDLASKSNPSLINDVTKSTDTQETQETKENSKSTEQPLDSVKTTEVRFQFTGTGYSNIMSFLKSIEDMNKTIITKNIRIAKATNGTGLDGEIIMGIYSLPKVDDKEARDLEFKPTIPTGKPDPFQ